MEERICRKAKS